MRIRRQRRNWFVFLGIFVAVGLFAFLVQKFENGTEVDAANMSAFDPGYIMSDYQMGNYNSMSEADIQHFLTAKNSCGNSDYNYYVRLSANQKYTWHWANGHFVCLSEERFGYNDNEIGSGETAAHIIWQAAQDYRINPQVLIVLLQKETGLITDPIPNNGDYRKATGYGCPDTAACSSKYYGFRNQVRNAAALFRTVLDGGWTNYPLGNNYVRYSPNAACGGTTVNIRSRATSALYRYTPYQPNAAALGSSYGYGDGCSAYGNRNFYAYFEDWFGDIKGEGWPSVGVVLSTNRVASEKSDLGFSYNAHVQHYGWLGDVNGGEMAGTAGYSLQLEAITMRLNGMAGIEYRSHIQNEGWEASYKKDGEMSGTAGRSLSIEAIQVRLNSSLAAKYNIYYRVHVAGIGWMDWVKNDEVAGTTGQGRKIEAMQVRIEKKYGDDRLEYSVHAQGIGWMDWVKNDEVAGTTGQGRGIESIKVVLPQRMMNEGDIEYSAYVVNSGWMDWVKNGEIAGTTGQGKRMEAVRLKLSDALAKKNDIYYRAHVSGIGWMDWVKNGEIAGVAGQGRNIEAVQIRIVDKDATSMSLSYKAHVASIGWMDWVKNGEIAGTTGRGRRVESIIIKVENNQVASDVLRYSAHVASIGWMDWVKNGEIAGTTGRALQVEAIKIELLNGLEKQYNLRYRAHVAGIGWMDWVKNGEIAGTTGRALQVEAIQIELTKK